MELHHRLVPFNYVIPGESVNGILDFRRLVEVPPLLRIAGALQPDPDPPSDAQPPSGNEFSGPAYRVINFVADLPIRIDDYLAQLDDRTNAELGSTIFVLTEFQILDAGTAATNESGENSHNAYKERQAARVKARLTGGSLARGHNKATPSEDEDE